jgi:glycosyltransferase involved in cell wall biosynthesis
LKKIDFHYISPSTLPSRAANSVHVMMQCEALAKLGAQVTLYAKRGEANLKINQEKVFNNYGIDFSKSKINFISYYSNYSRAVSLRIAYITLKHIFVKRFFTKNINTVDVILSRNLYAAYLIGILLKKPIIFETHQLETGFRKKLQKELINAPWVKTITISQKLVEFLESHHQCPVVNPLILHDAAPAGIVPYPDNVDRYALLLSILPDDVKGNWQAICGYFGHLYKGRGIEIIEQMAIARPNVLFVVVGGNPEDVETRKAAGQSKNIKFIGHVSHPIAKNIMKLVDILLMPYQESVSIGVSGHDTAKWMSPMKMFEYLASGTPIISSELPVLKEVLIDGENCLMVPPACAKSWVTALDTLLDNSKLSYKLGNQGHQQYCREHTWDKRALKILEAAETLS